MSMKRTTNNDLVCRDCIYRYDDSVRVGNTRRCEMYSQKSEKIFLENECDEYKKDDAAK
ncbi:MAG: hypothetical protein J1F64_03720 [Oscillospiraceae bacterium]|nr:hypothetical protein [Oscillospiraceae bacterium]